MSLNARHFSYALLAAALVLTPAAASAQGNLLQGIVKSLKKEKTAPAAPQKVAPAKKKVVPAPSGTAATKAPKKQPETTKRAQKSQAVPKVLGTGPAPSGTAATRAPIKHENGGAIIPH